MTTPRRCHPLMIVDTTYRTVFGLLVFIVLSFFESLFGESGAPADDLDEAGEITGSASPYLIAGFCILLAAVLFFSFLRWLHMRYALDDSNFILQKGRIVRNTVTLPFERINTVDLSQNLFHQVFGLSRLKLDSGSVEAGAKKAEIDLLLKTADAQELRAWILSRKALMAPSDGDLPVSEAPVLQGGFPGTDAPAQGEYPRGFSARTMDFIRLGLTSRKLAAFIVVVSAVVAFVSQFTDPFRWLPEEISLEEMTSLFLPLSGGLLIASVVLSNIVSLARTLLVYYRFQVYRSGDNICVSHGLLSKKSYTLPVAKIHCVAFKQNLIQQWLHLTEISVTTVGYGDEEKETAMLFPIAREREAELILDTLLPEFPRAAPTETPSPAGYVISFGFTALFFLLIFGGLSFISPFFWLGLLLLPICAVYERLKYKNAAIGMDRGVVCAVFGAFTKNTLYVRAASIQSVSARRGVFARRLGYYQAQLDYYGAKQGGVSLTGMRIGSFEKIKLFDL